MEPILLNIPLESYKGNLKATDQIIAIGNEVIDVAVYSLESLSKEYATVPGFLPLKEKMARTVDILKGFKDHKHLKTKYAVIYNQAVVLVVGNFESFLNELVVVLIEVYPFLIEWPDKKISLDLSVFKYSQQTVGEIILRSLREKFNFQDLKSTLNFFQEYLKLEITLPDDLKESIILFQAQRHIIIHNLGKIDDKYLQQIRDTKFAFQYSKGDFINITDETYVNAKASFVKFGEQIMSKILEKLDRTLSS